MKRIRIGTRPSELAVRQGQIVADVIRSRFPDVEVELVKIATRGDRLIGSLALAGGKGLFTSSLEESLRKGEIDLAVHSAKDLPVSMAPDLTIAAVPKREDPRDALLSHTGGKIDQLPDEAVVATSSLRRRAQLLAIRNDLKVVPIRGNVETRIRKVMDPGSLKKQPVEPLDATVLAMAGLKRLSLDSVLAGNISPLSVDRFIPAAGQGALVVQSLASTLEACLPVAELVSQLDDPSSRQVLDAERLVLQGLGADCHSCVAVHIASRQQKWIARGMFAGNDASGMVKMELIADSPIAAGRMLLEKLRHSCINKLFNH